MIPGGFVKGFDRRADERIARFDGSPNEVEGIRAAVFVRVLPGQREPAEPLHVRNGPICSTAGRAAQRRRRLYGLQRRHVDALMNPFQHVFLDPCDHVRCDPVMSRKLAAALQPQDRRARQPVLSRTTGNLKSLRGSSRPAEDACAVGTVAGRGTTADTSPTRSSERTRTPPLVLVGSPFMAPS